MPYIKEEDRQTFMVGPEGATYGVYLSGIDTPGKLNYLLTTVCDAYMKRGHKSYQEINDIVGALECAKMEFYRRIAIPYEEIKIKENGDVYA